MKKTGFIPPVIDETHYTFGGVSSLPQTIIRVDGDWTPYLPTPESQLENNFDSDGCTVYGTLNTLEILENALTNKETNYSDRFVYNVVGINPPGSDPHVVATNIRGSGLVLESDLPDDVSSLAEFMTPRPITVQLRVKGQQWFQKWHPIGHEWLWTRQLDKDMQLSLMKHALLYSPLGISVSAWWKNDKGLYYSPEGERNAHWVCCYKIDDTGIYVFDSYRDAITGSYLKKLTLDHNIEFCKRYSLTPTDPSQRSNWAWEIIKNVLIQIGIIQKKINELPKPPINPVIDSNPIPLSLHPKINVWADAIKIGEGARSSLNNPGNLKYAPLTASWEATKGFQASDGGWIAQFPTYERGYKALCDFLILGCKDELRAFHQARTFEAFTKIYAGNPPQGYIEQIRKKLGCNLDTNIATFL